MSNERRFEENTALRTPNVVALGEMFVPEDEHSLTATYRSTDWRDWSKITFYDFSMNANNPFIPGMNVESVHKND